MINIEFYPEEHCDECGEIIHNHFDCPVCGTRYASTSIYGYVCDDVKEMQEEGFTCEECDARFVLVNHEGGWDNWTWRLVEPSNCDEKNIIERLGR